MTFTIVDDSEPISFCPLLTSSSGTVNAALAECAACLTYIPVNTPMCVGKYLSRRVSTAVRVTGTGVVLCSKPDDGHMLSRENRCPSVSWCPLVYGGISDVWANLFELQVRLFPGYSCQRW